VEYEFEGRRLGGFPAEIEVLENVRVRYKNVPGWQQSTFGLRDYSELPLRAKDYLRFLSDAVGVEITMISTGPSRDQTIWMEASSGATLLAAR
jgi:adenylosuccinate synthase